MNQLRKLFLLIKELGVADLVSYSLYQAQLRSGYTRKLTPLGGLPAPEQFLVSAAPEFCWRSCWERLSGKFSARLMIEEARLLKDGYYRPFYATSQILHLEPPSQSSVHWIDVNEERFDDIKMVWEPARFFWSLTLAGVYRGKAQESAAELFWQKFDEFNHNNTVNAGPNWVSAQEVGMRAMMWIISISAFHSSAFSTSQRLERLIRAIGHHVERILPTLNYARSQHNNHILSESLCLMLAGDFLANLHPRAREWSRQGESYFNHALLRQVEEDGTYAQHSANYHRLMLQLSLLYHARMRQQNRELPPAVMRKLAAASRWMLAQLDPLSGRLPNLGHNDGTLLLPFGCDEFRDYRPTAQAASIAFLGQPCLPAGLWDELTNWLGLTVKPAQPSLDLSSSPAVHRVGKGTGWGTLRGVRFRNRPAHADQLHVDLWWEGYNIARDAGTYSYNLPPPWQNALDTTSVHNTITVNHQDQMQRMSRFLWLEQAQARWLEHDMEGCITANHNGYRRFGITHQRTLQFIHGSGFLVTDRLIKKSRTNRPVEYCLHWLLPDWNWQLKDQTLVLHGQPFTLRLIISALQMAPIAALEPKDVSLVRAGHTLVGTRADARLGWESDTYSEKHPALSFSLVYNSTRPIELVTRWEITDAER